MMEEYLQECILNQNLFQGIQNHSQNDGEIRWVDGWGEIIFDDEANELSMIE
jgi:hypothetical protein